MEEGKELYAQKVCRLIYFVKGGVVATHNRFKEESSGGAL
jgi:hypothetical protein